MVRDSCREPLSVWRNGRAILLDGHNRLKICEAHGLRFCTAEIEVPDRESAKIWIIENQFGRRNITPYQRGELALKLEPRYAAQAKERQREHGGTAPGREKTPVPTLARVSDAKKTHDELAKKAHVSHDTIARAKVIAERAPEPVKEKLRKGGSTDQQGVQGHRQRGAEGEADRGDPKVRNTAPA